MAQQAGGEPPAAAELAFEVKERAMDEAPIGITISDPDRPDNPLVYVNDRFEEMTGYSREEVLGENCRFLQGEESDSERIDEMREAVEREESIAVELKNYRKDGELFWNRVHIAPLRVDGEVTHFVGFQLDITERKRAEAAAANRAEELEHLVSRINGLLQDVTGALVNATSREEIETAVCDRLAAADAYRGAWIGERELAQGEVRVRTTAGAAAEAGLAIGLGSGDPVARAIEEQVTVVGSATPGALDEPHAGVLEEGQGLAAIPLVYGGTVRGVLVVYADDPDVFDDRETVVLEALGRSVAAAMDAIESKRVLVADDLVEIDLSVRDEGLFVASVSAEAGGRFEYAGSAGREDDRVALFFDVTGADPGAVMTAGEDHPEVAEVRRLTGHGGTDLFEFVLEDTGIVGLLADQGGETREIVAEGGEARVYATVPSRTDVRAVVEAVQGRYPETELAATWERERPPQTKSEYVATIEERLTERQLTALKRAFVGGYFDDPRRVTGDELAESMGISRSTFHQHLRAAQRKLLSEFFDRE